MVKPKLQKVFRDIRVGLSRHSPEILTGVGIAGMLTTTVLAVRATPKALELIEDEKEKQEVDKLPPIEVVKVGWKPYIPAVITGVCSTACLIGASSVNARRNAALATAYKLSETALTEYKSKVVETIGEKKEQAIREEIDKDHIERNPVSKKQIIITDGGDTLCYDTLSGRYFESSIEKIRRIENDLNARMLVDMYVSLDEFYDELGLEHTAFSYDLGWCVDKGLIKITFSSQIADNGKPCVVLNYETAPKYDYSKFV